MRSFVFFCGVFFLAVSCGGSKEKQDTLRSEKAPAAGKTKAADSSEVFYTTPFDEHCVEQVKALIRESAYHPVAGKDSMHYWIDSYGDSIFVVRAYVYGDEGYTGTFGWLELDLRGELRERGPNEDDPMKQVDFDPELLQRILERCR